MDVTTSKQVCEIVLGLLLADGELDERESSFLDRLKARFGVGPDAAIAPASDVDASLERLRALAEADRHETLALMVAAAAADGVVHPAERILLGAVAEELGIDEDELDQRLVDALSE